MTNRLFKHFGWGSDEPDETERGSFLGGFLGGADEPAADTDMGDGMGITQPRERHFNRESGRFHDPMDGEFERGSPPPGLDQSVDRYRANNGRFKKSSADLFDERAEEENDDLNFRG